MNVENETNKRRYDKKEKAKQIINLLEDVTMQDWSKIRDLIDARFYMINQKSNFSCDKVTLNRIENWF